MLKIELHTHTADDPVDAIPYTTYELIDRAAALGYDALAITLHEHQLDLRRFLPYAAERGIVLIPGVERTVEGRHVLLLNYKSGTEGVRSFADLAALKRRDFRLALSMDYAVWCPRPGFVDDRVLTHLTRANPGW